MRKNISLHFRIALLLFIILVGVLAFIFRGSWYGLPQAPFVTVQVKIDTMSAVSGIDLPLYLSITNDGQKTIPVGSVVVTVSREPRAGDFSGGSEFVVEHSIVSSGDVIKPYEKKDVSSVWRIPTNIPSGVYRIDAVFAHNGFTSKSAIDPKGVFGNSAKVYVTGEATESLFFISANKSKNDLSIVLVNKTANDIKVPVKLQTLEKGVVGKVIDYQSQIVAVSKNSSKEIQYSTTSKDSVYGITAETSYKKVPAFYVFGKVSTNESNKEDCYFWLMFLGGLGVVILGSLYVKDLKNNS